MPGVSREQIDRAKQIDILDYLLQHEPNNIKRVGKAHYLIDHDSLRISNNMWLWESQSVGGKNVIDYLVKVRGYSFVEAVQHLTGDYIAYKNPVSEHKKQEKVEKTFALPARNKTNERVIAYLQSRGIDKTLTLECIRQGSIYETAHWRNCVFVGRDESGKARYATLRGTVGDFKRDVEGSDKRYGFVIPQHGSDTVAVFESPVDALSHQKLYPRFRGWRLSLGGTSLAALTGFLERHNETKSVIICTDNDDAGDRAAKKIRELKGVAAVRMLPPNKQKDWNDALLSMNMKPSLAERLEYAKTHADNHKTARQHNTAIDER